MEEIAGKLKNNRNKFRLTVEQVSRETNVRSSMISALEENKMDLLPAPYIQAFIKTLNEFYQKIENDSEYLNFVKSSTVSKNKTVKNANVKNTFSEKTPQKQSQPKQKNASKTIATVEQKNNDKNGIERIDAVENRSIEEGFVDSQLKNVFTNQEIKLETTDNFDDKNDDKNLGYDDSSEGFTVKEKNIFSDKNSKSKDSGNKDNSKDISDNNSDNSGDNQAIEGFANEKKQKNKKTKINQKISKTKKYFTNSLNLSRRDLFIYSFLLAFFAGVIFFIFFYEEDMFDNFMGGANIAANSEEINGNDAENVQVIAANKNELFSYFDPIDSIVLSAKCIDTAWVKVEIDNRKTDELLMVPGAENRWAAWERIVLNTSNVGGIVFSKNDTVLPKLGATGTMVKNIVITREGIANATPLTTSNNPVSANELNPSQVKINSSETDTARVERAKSTPRKRRTDTVKPPPIIDFSPAPPTRPEILE